MQAKFTSALIYPALVICVGIALVAFFMFFMMPEFTNIFNGFGVELPLPTRMLIGVQHVSHRISGGCSGLVVIVAVILFFRFKASEAGGRMTGRMENESARRSARSSN